jgi:hypothetical protein
MAGHFRGEKFARYTSLAQFKSMAELHEVAI